MLDKLYLLANSPYIYDRSPLVFFIKSHSHFSAFSEFFLIENPDFRVFIDGERLDFRLIMWFSCIAFISQHMPLLLTFYKFEAFLRSHDVFRFFTSFGFQKTIRSTLTGLGSDGDL